MGRCKSNFFERAKMICSKLTLFSFSILALIFLIQFSTQQVLAGNGPPFNPLPPSVMGISKTQAPSPCVANVGMLKVIDYNINLVKFGPSTVFNVILTDVLPAGSMIDEIPGGCMLDAGNNELTCNLNNLNTSPPPISFSISITPESENDVISNTAIVDFGTDLCTFPNPNFQPIGCEDVNENCPIVQCLDLGQQSFCGVTVFGNDFLTNIGCDGPGDCPQNECVTFAPITPPSSTVSCTVEGNAAVSINKTCIPTNITQGEDSTIMFNIQANETAGQNAFDVTITDDLPEGAEFIPDMSPGCMLIEELPNTVRCTIDEIPANGQDDVTIAINILPLTPGTITNSASVTFNEGMDGNSSFCDIIVNPAPTPTPTPTQTPTTCDPQFSGIFQGNTDFMREPGTTFPENEELDDPTTLEITDVTDSSLSGTINAAWLPNVAITDAQCTGNTATFTGSFGGVCPGMISGTIELDAPNEIFLSGNGDDCKNSPYTFDGLLFREGTQGNPERSAALGSATAGCSIARSSVGTTLTPMLILLLLPLFISIRRGISILNKIQNNRHQSIIENLGHRFQNKSQVCRDLANKLQKYIFFLMVSLVITALLLITVTPAYAQKLIKQCPDSPNAAQFEIVCNELLQNQGSLDPQQQSLFDTCERLFATPDDDQEACNDIDNLTQATEIAAIYSTTLRAQSSNQINNVLTRISDVRSGVASSISINGIAMKFEREKKSKASARKDLTLNPIDQNVAGPVVADVTPFAITTQTPDQGSGIASKLGFFLNSSFNFGERDTTRNEPGFDFDIFEITFGVDYLFTDYLLLGLSFNYYYTDIDLKASRGDVSSNTFSGSLYGGFFWDQFYADGVFTLGGSNYDINRTTDQGSATGDTSGAYYALALGAGYDFQFGSFGIGPYGRFTYNQANIGSYTESGAAGLQIGSQKAKSLTTALGGQATYAWSTSIGVFVPQFLLEWVHEYKDDPVTTRASFAAADGLENNPTFTIRSDEPDRNTFNIGGGISATFAHGISAFIYYENSLGWDDVDSHYIGGGFRLEL